MWNGTHLGQMNGKAHKVIVFEINGTEHVIGGLEPQDSVYELTLRRVKN